MNRLVIGMLVCLITVCGAIADGLVILALESDWNGPPHNDKALILNFVKQYTGTRKVEIQNWQLQDSGSNVWGCMYFDALQNVKGMTVTAITNKAAQIADKTDFILEYGDAYTVIENHGLEWIPNEED